MISFEISSLDIMNIWSSDATFRLIVKVIEKTVL